MSVFGKIQIHQVLISLLFGVILGMLAQQCLFHYRFDGHPKHERMKGRMLDKMSHELDLMPEQKEKIEAIFESKRPQMKALHEQMRPRFEELRQKTQAEIKALLNPEQQKKFDEMNARMEKKLQERFKNKEDWPRD